MRSDSHSGPQGALRGNGDVFQKLLSLGSNLTLLKTLALYGIHLKPSKREWSHPIRCPFDEHKGGKENTSSFGYNFNKDYFNCFGCGSGGGVVEFISKKEGIPKQVVRDRLRGRLSITNIVSPNLDIHLIKLANWLRSQNQTEDLQKVLWWFDSYLDQGESLEEEELCARIAKVYQVLEDNLDK